MGRDDFQYANLVAEIRDRLPALRGELDRFLEQWRGEEIPVHLAFSEVVYEGLAAAANRGSTDFDELAEPLFSFLEIMAAHPDTNVQNIAYVSFCEPLCANESLLQKSRRYMGPGIRRYCDRIIAGN